MYFGKLSEGELKGSEVLIQFMDKRICGIRKKSGKLKPLTRDDIDQARKQAKPSTSE